MANYNLTQTGDEVQAYIDSIPVIDVTGTLSGSTITFGSNPYSQIAANYAADCSSIVRLTVGTAVYLLRVTQYDGTNYTAAEMSGAHNVVATIGSSSASATIDAGIDATPTQGSNNLVKSGGVWGKLNSLQTEVEGAEVEIYAPDGYNTWRTGYYLYNGDGGFNTSTVNSITLFIDISDYEQIKTIVNVSTSPSSSVGCVCFYDENKTYLQSCVTGDMGERGHADVLVDVPEDAVYARFTCYNTELAYWYLSGIKKDNFYLTKDVVGASISRLSSDVIITGKYRTSEGNVATSSPYFYSLPIAVSVGDRFVLRNSAAGSNISIITRVTEDGDVLSVIQRGTSSNSSLSDYDIEFDFNGYVSISGYALSARNVVFFKSKMNELFAQEVSELESQMSTINTDIDSIKESVGLNSISLTDADVTKGKYRNIEGHLVTLSGYFYSIPFYVKKGTRIITTESITVVSAVSFVSKVDANNNYISTLVAGNGVNTTYDYTIEEDCYIGLSCMNQQLSLLRIIPVDLQTQLDNLSTDTITIEPTTRLVANDVDNPLSVIMRECGYGCLLKTWGFIGDSYTSGETPAYDGTTMKYLDCYKWSWGQQFMKIIGSEGYNFSNGGQTAKGWLRSQGTVHDESYYGGVGGGDWRQAQSNLKQGYIISLGINDNGYFGQTYLGATYSLGDVATDVDVSDYTQNNENTFAGCYAGIVQRILSVQPKAKIFCVTQFQDTLEQVNDVVREIVALFPNNVFLIDLHDFALNIVNEQYYMSNGHPSPFGYAYMAYCINTYVDYIIRSQKQKFMDVTLIGSNYNRTL